MVDIVLCVLLLMLVFLLWNMEQLLLRYMLITKEFIHPITISLKILLDYVCYQLRRFLLFIRRLLSRNKTYFRGIPRDHIELLQHRLEIAVIEA